MIGIIATPQRSAKCPDGMQNPHPLVTRTRGNSLGLCDTGLYIIIGNVANVLLLAPNSGLGRTRAGPAAESASPVYLGAFEPER